VSTTVTLSRNFPDLGQLELTTVDDMRELGLLLRERIITRTRQAIGPNGVRFEDLSVGYATKKLLAVGTSNPDLTLSGNMLNHITITNVEAASVTLGWVQ
jgi:hypothetical protein